MIERQAVFAHSMWRTGSTFLASRFAQSERHMLFYEPFHEYIGSPKTIAQAATMQRAKLASLRHADVGGGYFDSFMERDPLTGLNLWKLYPFSAGLRDVYNQAAPETIAYLEACIRVAAARDRIAFFGFCSSGSQQSELRRRLDGTHLHLWRSPREQFQSYDWPANDYFMPGTLIQLLLSRRLEPVATALAGGGIPRGAARVIEALPDRAYRMRYRFGRWLCRRLPRDRLYALFYLSWHVSRHSAQAQPELDFSLTAVAADRQKRDSLETLFGVDFGTLRPTPARYERDIAYEAIEAEVRARLAAPAPEERRSTGETVAAAPGVG